MTLSVLTQPEFKLWLLFRGSELLVNVESSDFPQYPHYDVLGLSSDEEHRVGEHRGLSAHVVRLPETAVAPEGYHFQSLRSLLLSIDAESFSLAATASQILEWYRSHRFCSRCGTPTAAHPRGERARVCPSCGYHQYPRIHPCVIVAITKNDSILLARAQRFTRPMYSLLAGFVEVGETLEHAVIREVAEESGIQVKNLRYFGSQSWPFPNNLMLAFQAEWESGDIVIQEEEIMDAQFFRFDNLPEIPPSGSIASQVIHATVTELAAKYR
jgi:NAD+ diphosphatase